MSSQHILSMGLESDLTPDFVEEFHEAQESVVRRLVLGPRQLAQIAAAGLLFLMFCSAISYRMGSLQAAQVKRPGQSAAPSAAASPLVLSRISTDDSATASSSAEPSSSAQPDFTASAVAAPAAKSAAKSDAQPEHPAPGTYLQVGVVAKPQFEARSAALRSMGLNPSVIAGPDDSTLRMLVGPLATVAEREKAMNTLDEHGMQWFVKTIAAQ